MGVYHAFNMVKTFIKGTPGKDKAQILLVENGDEFTERDLRLATSAETAYRLLRIMLYTKGMDPQLTHMVARLITYVEHGSEPEEYTRPHPFQLGKAVGDWFYEIYPEELNKP